MEVIDHLLQSVQDGESEEIVVKNFLSPQELGKQIISEYQQLYSHSKENSNELTLNKKSNAIGRFFLIFLIIIILVITFVVGLFLANQNNSPNNKDNTNIIEYEHKDN